MKKEHFFTFLLIHGFVWSLISLGFFHINGFFTGTTGIIFTFLFIFAHLFSLVWLLALLCLPWRLVGPRTFQGVCVAVSTFFSLLLLLDLFIFSQYRFHIGLDMLELFFGSAGGEIFIFPVSMWLVFAGVVILVLTAELGGVWISKRFGLSTRRFVCFLGIWLLSFLLYNGLYAWGKFMLVPSIVSQRKVLPLAYPLSANSQLASLGFVAKKEPYFVPKKGLLNYPLAPLTCQLPEHPKNILLIVIDSWRADVFTPQVMPRLFEWSKHPGMTVFANHLAGGNATEAGIFSLFYSLPHNYWDDFVSLHLPPVLMTETLSRGYVPAIFASAKLNSPAFYRNVFASVKNLRLTSVGDTSWQRDVNAVDDFEEFLQNRSTQEPFLGFIFLDGPHGFSYPEEEQIFTPAQDLNYFLLTNTTDPTPYWNQYKNSVYFADKLVDRLLTLLQKQHLLENTVVIITGDHGQELNDSHHNFWGHNSNFTDYQTHVPLLVYQNGRNAPSRVTYRTSHYDVAPTLMQEVLHCTNSPTDYGMGYSLFDDTPRPFTLFASHTAKAIRVGDSIVVLDNFDGMQQYDNHLQPISDIPSPALIKDGLKSFSRFYK